MAERRVNGEGGQALLLLVGALAAVLVGAFVLGAIARGVGKQGADQRAADLGALAGARAMRTVYYRLFEPASIGGRRNPRHLERSEYLRRGRAAGAGHGGAQRRARSGGGVPRRRRDRARAHPRDGVRSGRGDRGRPPRGGGDPRPRRGGAGAARRRSCGLRERWRVQRPPRLPAGQADATGRGDRLRPHGGCRLARRRLADHHERVPQRCRAGGPVRSPSRPQVGGAARALAAPPRHRARPRPARRLRLAGRERDAVRLPQALQLGALAFRLHAQPRLGVGRVRSEGRGRRSQRPRRAVVRAGALRAGDQPRGACAGACQRGAAQRPALRRVGLQPVRRQLGRGARDRPVHARHRRLLWPGQPVRRRGVDQRAGAHDARPARGASPRSRSRWPPTTPARAPSGAAAASRPTPRRAATSPASSACSPARATPAPSAAWPCAW